MGKVSTDRLKLLVKMSGVFKKAESPDDEIWSEIVAIYEELLAFREGYDPAKRLPEPGQRCVVHYRWVGTDTDAWAVEVAPTFGVPWSWVLQWYPIGGAE